MENELVCGLEECTAATSDGNHVTIPLSSKRLGRPTGYLPSGCFVCSGRHQRLVALRTVANAYPVAHGTFVATLRLAAFAAAVRDTQCATHGTLGATCDLTALAAAVCNAQSSQ